MSKTTAPAETSTPTRNSFAVGLTMFAGAILMLVAFFQVFLGLVAIFGDEYVVVTPNYIFSFDTTLWGWIHVALGVLLGAAAWFIYQGKVWARTVGVAAAGLNAVANFAWLPHTPVWSALIIALDVLVIWALTAHGRDIITEA